MKEIHKDDLMILKYDESRKYLHYEWGDKTEGILPHQYKETLLKYAEAVETHSPDVLLVDDRNSKFTVPPDLQEWLGDVIFPRVTAAGLKKYAVIMHDDFIKRLATEQAVEENREAGLQHKLFSSKEEAEAWLFE